MVSGLDVLGAGEGLSGSYIIVRVNKIDGEKLKSVIEKSGMGPTQKSIVKAVIPTGTAILDRIPKAVLDVALPSVAPILKNKYGVDATITTADAPPVKGQRRLSEFFPGLLVGGALGLSAWAIWHYGISKLVARLGN